MSRQIFLNLPHLRFPLALALLLILVVIQIGRSESKNPWCCQGWSDDESKPGQVDTIECLYGSICRGTSVCADPAQKDCVTNWQCAEATNGTFPPKTDDDCEKPGVGKDCYCDKPWCNCPQSMRKKETPMKEDKSTCCFGSSAEAPEKLLKKQCDLRSFSCLGQTQDNNVTNFNCGYTNNGRLREKCYGFSSPKKYGDGSDFCRCNTDYCNCPKGSGGEKTSRILNTRFAMASGFFLLLTFDSTFYF